jgi:hypothetical protein
VGTQCSLSQARLLTWQSSGTGRQRLRLGFVVCILPCPRCRALLPAPYFYVIRIPNDDIEEGSRLLHELYPLGLGRRGRCCERSHSFRKGPPNLLIWAIGAFRIVSYLYPPSHRNTLSYMPQRLWGGP